MQLWSCQSCQSYLLGPSVHHRSHIHFKHVKGHQDELLSISLLPCLAQLNILADQLAKCSLVNLLQHCQCWVGLLVGDAWSLQVDNQTITSDPHAHIIWCLGYCTAYKYMVEKNQHISPTGFASINFPALSAALKSASPLYWLWFSKFVSGHSATGCMMCLCKKWDNAFCPCCGQDRKTTWHILICPDPSCRHLEYCSKLLIFKQWSTHLWTKSLTSSSACSKDSIWSPPPYFPHLQAHLQRLQHSHKTTLVGSTFSLDSLQLNGLAFNTTI